MAATIHVTPLNDLVAHNTDSDDASCVCGPQTVPVEIGGQIAWAFVHASLDGREFAGEDYVRPA
ncbi:hypothetical protein AB0D56_10215 [Streptomyces sp. NPDC048209]|uniref:hypothetical protein n=1 Tax=Streptomyces sp. NPDC048209 TaxID=3156689 RepID=UPI0034285AB4